MTDIIYLATSIAFFGLMLFYVKGCERLGRGASGAAEPSDAARS